MTKSKKPKPVKEIHPMYKNKQYDPKRLLEYMRFSLWLKSQEKK